MLVGYFSLCISGAYGDGPGNRSSLALNAVRITGEMNLDGILSEPLYQQNAFETFTQRNPNENGTPSERTEVWIGYDDAALYIGARLYDAAPDSIERRLARKDANILADEITFYIDGYRDRQSGYYFGINAAGTLYDGILYNDDWNDDTWDGIWEGKAHIDSAGWTAEMRIPFSQFRFALGDGNGWALNFKRVIARKNEEDYIVFTPKNGSGFVSRFVDLRGIEKVDPPRRIELLPYITEKAEFSPHASGDPFHDGSSNSFSTGMDFKLGLGSNLTINGAINPDFGQVEVDPAVVNLSDVETFYAEKRPFFLEGSDIFNFGRGGTSNNWSFNWSEPTLFYSRRIGRSPEGSVAGADYVDIPSGTHILSAAKFSGKTGNGWSLGGIGAVTGREVARADSAGVKYERDVEPLTYYGVFRAQKELNEGRHGIGFISTFTQRDFTDTYLPNMINSNALVGGLDGWTALDNDKTWVLKIWTGATRVQGSREQMLSLQQGSQHYYQRPDAPYLHLDSNATSLSGYAGRMFLTKQKGNFVANAALGVVSPGFDVNDLGFQWRTDVINMHTGVGYLWTVPTGWYRSLSLEFAGFQTLNFGGDVTWRGVWGDYDIVLPNYYEFNISYAYNPQTLSDHLTRGGPKTLTPLGYEISGNISGDSRNSIIPGLSFDSYQASYGKTYNYNWTLDWKPASSVEIIVGPGLSRDWEYSQWVGDFADPLARATYGKHYVFGEMDQTSVSASIQINWAFSPVLSLQAYIQPLISVGKFSNIKELSRPSSYDFLIYGTGGSEIHYDSLYHVDPDGSGPAPSFSFANPDFNFKSLRGDAVLRWEFEPGSTLYLVWTQSRTSSTDPGVYRFGRDLHELLSTQPDNIFLMKIAYWVNP